MDAVRLEVSGVIPSIRRTKIVEETGMGTVTAMETIVQIAKLFLSSKERGKSPLNPS